MRTACKPCKRGLIPSKQTLEDKTHGSVWGDDGSNGAIISSWDRASGTVGRAPPAAAMGVLPKYSSPGTDP